jgi:hypothetical protein
MNNACVLAGTPRKEQNRAAIFRLRNDNKNQHITNKSKENFMYEPSQQSSKEQAVALEKAMPELWHRGAGWKALINVNGIYPTQKVHQVAELVLSQQRDIEQLKTQLEETRAELAKLKQKL